MASAVAELIAGKLAGLVWDEATLLWDFKDDVDRMKGTMEDLRAWMRDADRRSNLDDGDDRESVQVWMKKLKSGAYDVEDLLDKFEAIQLAWQSQSKIKTFFSSYNPLLVRLTMAYKMKKVKEELDIIKEEGHHLNLVHYETPTWAKESTSRVTIAMPDGDLGIGMVGRNTEKENIMRLLLQSEAEEDISIIPIVGLGGLGKTTLAQAVFSDKRAKIFDLRVWVYVSKQFDLSRIGKTIISIANSSIGSGRSENVMPPQNCDLETILIHLQNVLSTKRYLIVLDDVWEDNVNNLEKLKSMLRYGKKGSKIILTTRTQQVVKSLDIGELANKRIIRPVHKDKEITRINLNFLSVDDCWNVMRQTAFRRDDDLGGLEVIGRQIAAKCSGLPLLARSLGFLMSQYKSTQAWEEIRDRKIILDIKEDHQSPDTLRSLMLSYYYIPFNFKLCFTYCAVFPKGFAIATDQLIQQWIALGYIQRVDGHRCINYLLGMSFLNISESSQSALELAGAPGKLTMHDLVHDLARIILDDELIILDASVQMSWTGPEKRYGRHMHLSNYQKQSKVIDESAGKIRSLHFTVCNRMRLQRISYSKCKYLRVLDLSGCSIEENPALRNILLPSSIYQLMLLRYLDASGLPITALSKSLHKLQNMQTLIMSNCTLETLPDNIGSLLNLDYLDLSGNSILNKIPVSLGMLSALSFLRLSGCFKLEELPESIHNLESLRYLDMSGCCALQKLPDKFGSLQNLLFLNLSNCSKLVKLPDNLNLMSLEHLNLSSCHELQNLPLDFGNLHKLEFLNLSDCYKIQMLPESFCQLKHLKDLDLSDCHDLKELPACFGNLSGLHSLNLTSCSKLQSLPESFGNLSKLKHLNLSFCGRLENLPSSFGNLKLQVLELEACYNLKDLPDSIGSMASLAQFHIASGNRKVAEKYFEILLRLNLPYWTTHDVHETDSEGCSNIVELGNLTCHYLEVRYLDNVKYPEDAKRAKLRDNPELRDLELRWSHGEGMMERKTDAEVLENLIPPRTLEHLRLHWYMSKDFPAWMRDISSYLPYLTAVQLYGLKACDSIPPFGQLPNLRYFELHRIPNIRKIGKEFYGEEGTCKKLRVIDLTSLENLVEWWTTRSGDEGENFLIPNLHQFRVRNCPKLKFLPYPPKSMEWHLENSDEVLPEHGFGRLSSSTSPFEATVESSNFTLDTWCRLQHLRTLEHLFVTGHRSLMTLPDVSPCFPYLRNLQLSLKDLEALPEWLGQLTSLEALHFVNCPNVIYLPKSIWRLTALKFLEISGCPKLRLLREDFFNIFRIEVVKIDDKIIPHLKEIEGPEFAD